MPSRDSHDSHHQHGSRGSHQSRHSEGRERVVYYEVRPQITYGHQVFSSHPQSHRSSRDRYEPDRGDRSSRREATEPSRYSSSDRTLSDWSDQHPRQSNESLLRQLLSQSGRQSRGSSSHGSGNSMSVRYGSSHPSRRGSLAGRDSIEVVRDGYDIRENNHNHDLSGIGWDHRDQLERFRREPNRESRPHRNYRAQSVSRVHVEDRDPSRYYDDRRR